jgi:hypothetical protein
MHFYTVISERGNTVIGLRPGVAWSFDYSCSLHNTQCVRTFGCRHAAATPQERRRNAAKLAAGERVTAAGEALALAWLHCAASAVLAALPTTAEADEALLADMDHVPARAQSSKQATEPAAAGTSMSGNEPRDSSEDECLRLAVQWRLEYKR